MSLDKKEKYENEDDLCDLYEGKICNSCGDCLGLNNLDTRAVKVASIIEDEENAKVIENTSGELIDSVLEDDCDEDLEMDMEIDDSYTNEDLEKEYVENLIDGVDIEYIDDIEGLNDILDDELKKGSYMEEVFPGFFTIKK
ncbi:hypothetical protein CM240_1234 [Clostridium bornimense]|uniref:Uncharacterized protein n=1 Tax=Clostridium bornimense TaxID=1216932 RepID=W6RVQ9_9CLOT|nr:hypothetical protein [Clostridium bornimense]CDM68398.1 hypothetical protein CM240_1234 [Clostridium bornimense]